MFILDRYILISFTHTQCQSIDILTSYDIKTVTYGYKKAGWKT